MNWAESYVTQHLDNILQIGHHLSAISAKQKKAGKLSL